MSTGVSRIESTTAIELTTPERTCVGCRKAVAKSELLRVVSVDGVITADPRARLAGRGAYLHRDPECLRKAESRRAFQRAFRLTQAPVGIEELRMSMATHSPRGSVTG